MYISRHAKSTSNPPLRINRNRTNSPPENFPVFFAMQNKTKNPPTQQKKERINEQKKKKTFTHSNDENAFTLLTNMHSPFSHPTLFIIT